MNQPQQPDKAEVVRFLLEQEGRVMLCIDATQDGVDAPKRLTSDQGLRLILNEKMPQPIDVGKDAIESELRFGGIPHYCIIPYVALWGAFNPDTGHGMFWPESMPEAIRTNFERNHTLDAATPPPMEGLIEAPTPIDISAIGDRGKPRLTVIEGEGEPPTTDAPPRRRSKPNLRLVD